MQRNILLLIVSLFILQGCSQKGILEPTSQEKQLLEIQNIDALDKKINLFINEKYTSELSEKLLLGIHYDAEYINTENKTEIFIKYKI